MAIQDVITHVQGVLPSSVTAIKYAPDYPTDKSLTVPTAITYADNITLEMQGGFTLTFFDLRVDVMIPRRALEDAMRFLAGIPETVFGVFSADPTLGGHCQTFGGEMSAKVVSYSINGVEMIGYSMVAGRVKI